MRRGTKMAGFTLVELLVVIAIIGILVSLTMTHLGPTLANVRRNQCANRLRQICLAATNYEIAHDRLPGYCQKFGEFNGGLDPSDPGSYGGNVPAHVKIGSWSVALLEKLDQQPLYETWSQDRYPLLSDGGGERRATRRGYSAVAATNLSIYQCPSATVSLDRHGRNSYIANTGLHSDVYPFTYTRPGESLQSVSFARSIHEHNGVFTNRYAGIDPADSSKRISTGKAARIEDFKDGRSHTMLFSESNQAVPWHLTRLTSNPSHLTNVTMINGERLTVYPRESRYLQGAVWHFEDSMRYAGARPVDPVHKLNGGDVNQLRMTAANMADVARPSSLHAGGVNIGFADGRVEFIVESINYRVYQSIMTPSSRSSDMPMNQFMITADAI